VTETPALILLAAGLGSRFKGLKPLEPIGPNGETVIDYNAADAVAAGFGPIVLVVRAEIREIVEEHVRERWPDSVEVAYAVQDTDAVAVAATEAGRAKPLGTAHAVLVAVAARAIDSPFGVANGDDIYGPASFQALGDHLRAVPEHALVGIRVENAALAPKPVNRALLDVAPDGLLRDIEEGSVQTEDGRLWYSGADGRVSLTGRELVSMNLFGFQASIVDPLQHALDSFLAEGRAVSDGEVLLPDVVRTLVTDQLVPVRVLPSEEQVLGITHGEDADALRRTLRRAAW
jgi:NDP-sugar pyrophosphorylase family protein